LTDEQRKRWMTLLLDTADELNLPDDPRDLETPGTQALIPPRYNALRENQKPD
jgi:hypothetical protein